MRTEPHCAVTLSEAKNLALIFVLAFAWRRARFFAQDDSDFDLHEWAVGICTPSAKVRLDRDFRNLEFTLYNLPFLFGGDRET